MILVAGILVLLVILAASFMTRAQGGRVTSTATQHLASTESSILTIRDDLASEVVTALFPWPIDLNSAAIQSLNLTAETPSANIPRLRPFESSIRYERDPQDVLDVLGNITPDGNGDGFPDGDGISDYPYNRAPYHVVPWTNWPDYGGLWPTNPNGAGNGPAFEANPWGNPGYGDTRWLRDVEPVRWDSNANGRNDAFAYWRHMTNISRANNGYRIVWNIADVTGVNMPVVPVVSDLDLPVEQWPISVGTNSPFSTCTGSTIYDPATFENRWFAWFTNYTTAYTDPNLIPPNFYDLKDLNGNGIRLELGERPQDEFIGGTDRWNVSRVLVDTDGDGFTDSYWFLAPTPIQRGIRQVVAMSIVDNSALFPANVATRFDYLSSTGETPSDLALIGWQDNAPAGYVGAVGFLDNRENWTEVTGSTPGFGDWPPIYDANAPGGCAWVGSPYSPGMQGTVAVTWSPLRWEDFLRETRTYDNPLIFNSPDVLDRLLTPLDRRRYWLNSGSRPFNAMGGFTPFTVADELELRMYHGNNHPWILSRFERAMDTSQNAAAAFLRAPTGDETNEYQEQLFNAELLHDNRRRITLFSGARNDEMPPWIAGRRGDFGLPPAARWLTDRWRWDFLPYVIENAPLLDVNGNGVPDAAESFLLRTHLKLDLREAAPTLPLPGNFDVIGFPGPASPARLPYFHERLTHSLLMAMTQDGDGLSTGISYLDAYNSTTEADEVRRLVAGYAANILAYRDDDTVAMTDLTLNVAPLQDDPITDQVGAVPLPRWASQNPTPNPVMERDLTRRMLGMERQPFLMEAFIAHVYGSESVPPPVNPADPLNTSYSGFPGNNYVDEDHYGTTVVVVQIANPYDRAIPLEELRKYRIRVFGRDLDLLNINGLQALEPATEDNPATAIFALVQQTFDHPTLGSVTDFRTKWEDFLDLIRNEDGVLRHSNDSQIYLFDQGVGPNPIPNANPWEGDDRSHYDTWTPGADENAIELRRIDTGDPGDVTDDAWVVVDRFDYDDDEADHDQFLDQVQQLTPPPVRQQNAGAVPPLLSGARIGGDDFLVQWTRVARAWGLDEDAIVGPAPDGVQFDERAPRYVIANQGVTPDGTQDLSSFDGDLNPGGVAGPYHGAAYIESDDPDLPWFDYPYESLEQGPTGPIEVQHKPTFFDHQALEFNNGDPYIAFPDKGFYGENIPLLGSMQMLQKDYDFQQVGELLNVWLLGHELSFVQAGADPLNPRDYDYEATKVTFSEFMHKTVGDLPQLERHRANRLNTTEGEVLGLGSAANPRDGQHAVPDLPAALRVLDMFVCDGPGVNYNPTTDAYGDLAFGNAALFEGRPTYGLININTAPIEVMRTLPHWYKTVHNDPAFVPEDRFPKVAIAESAVSYRERIANPIFPPPAQTIGFAGGPDYSDRPIFQGEQVREERGFASIGELRLLTQAGTADIPFPFSPPVPQAWSELFQDAWSIEFAANDPFDRIVVTTPAAHMSTDVVPVRDPGNPLNFVTPPVLDSTLGDAVSGDAEEENMLFAGASNLVTTRSDFFTVYFRVRSFRENESGVWDATNPEYIVDDTRYVMLLDRSQVNRPSDKPRIVYFEKLP